MTDDMIRPVQGPRYTMEKYHSDTEIARVVAEEQGWSFGPQDQLLESSQGALIAETISDAAAAMRDLGWIRTPDPNRGGFVDRNTLPHAVLHSGEAAEMVRGKLTPYGQHEMYRAQGPKPIV